MRCLSDALLYWDIDLVSLTCTNILVYLIYGRRLEGDNASANETAELKEWRIEKEVLGSYEEFSNGKIVSKQVFWRV